MIIVSLGYGKTQGVAHKGKSASDAGNMTSESPAWFKQGIEAALPAPTAIIRQKPRIELDGNRVTAKSGFLGPCLKVDLGIVKYHFELGAGKDSFTWA